MISKTTGTIVAVGLMAVTFLSGCTGTTTNSNTSTRTTVTATGQTPRTAPVERRTILASATLQGKVTAPPTRYAEIVSPFRAPVEKVYVTMGATVKAGDILVELSANSAKQFYEQARVNLQTERSNYEAALSRFNVYVAAAHKRLSDATQEETLARQGSSPAAVVTVPVQADAPDTESGVTTPASPANTPSLDKALQDEAEAKRGLADANAYVANALLPFKQRLDGAQGAFDEAQAGRKAAMLRSPIYGQVVALEAAPGMEVGDAGSKPLAIICDLAFLKVSTLITQDQSARIKEGMPVTLTFNEIPNQRFEGKVEQVAIDFDNPDGAGEKQRYVVSIGFTNKDGLVKPHMSANAMVVEGQETSALAVPAAAVSHDVTGKPQVTVLRGGKWQVAVIDPGLSDGQFVAVKSGLAEGETVQLPLGQ